MGESTSLNGSRIKSQHISLKAQRNAHLSFMYISRPEGYADISLHVITYLMDISPSIFYDKHDVKYVGHMLKINIHCSYWPSGLPL